MMRPRRHTPASSLCKWILLVQWPHRHLTPNPAHPRQRAQRQPQLVTPAGRRWFPAEAGETSAKQKLNLE